MSSSLLTVILIIAVITAGCLAEQVYYVTPNATTACPPTARPGACQTLRHYVNKSHEYFQSDTTFYFLSGTHWLDIQEPVVILGIKRLKMIGDNRLIPSLQGFMQFEPSAVISCNSRASGFVFGVVHSLQIANLSFMHCSADVISAVVHLFPDIPPGYYTQNVTAALGFLLVEDLHLSGVLVQNNTGYGLTALNLLGNSSIVNSIFVFNRGDEYHPGGNALVYFMLIELMCTLFPHKTMNLNITSSKFMHGSTMAFAGLRPFPPGLGIVLYQECSHVTICINNSVFSDNYNKKDLAFLGANLAIVTANPKYNTAFHTIVIDNCCIERGRAGFGGGVALYALESWKYTPPHASCTVNNTDQASSVQIINTEIVQNTATYAAGGLAVALNISYKYIVEIRNTTFSGNSCW